MPDSSLSRSIGIVQSVLAYCLELDKGDLDYLLLTRVTVLLDGVICNICCCNDCEGCHEGVLEYYHRFHSSWGMGLVC